MKYIPETVFQLHIAVHVLAP